MKHILFFIGAALMPSTALYAMHDGFTEEQIIQMKTDTRRAKINGIDLCIKQTKEELKQAKEELAARLEIKKKCEEPKMIVLINHQYSDLSKILTLVSLKLRRL